MTDQEKVKSYFSGYLIFGNQLARIINIYIYIYVIHLCYVVDIALLIYLTQH